MVGSRVVLKCKVNQCGKNIFTSWKKIHPDSWVIRNSGRILVSQSEDGEGLLIINNAKITDSGVYMCMVSNENAYSECSATLTVLDSDVNIPELKAQIISCSSVALEWENSDRTQFLVEFCKVGSGEWISPNNNLPLSSHSYVIEHLVPSDTYSFRLVALPSRQVGLPSAAVTLPVADNLRWQQEQFKRRYIELEEIDRGRCAIIRKAQDRGTGQEVALKQVFRRKQSHQVTQAEYSLLVGLQHTNIIHAMALFDNAPVPGIDTIVLELVHGPLLFSYIVQNDSYSEGEICSYTKQLVIALSWLHSKDIAHLDIKPENIMVDLSHEHPTIKLVDFGDCVNTAKNVILPPTCLEFASPELVLGQQVGKHTDLWAVGVLIYVMLSGVSPFLDDSVEETTANILKCDFCFPDDYFSNISEQAKALIRLLLNLVPKQRITMEECQQNQWFENVSNLTVICSSRLRAFLQRRRRTTPSPSNQSLNNVNI